MKRTPNIVKNMDLLRKLAWSFHNTTNLPFEELLSESVIAYYSAQSSYKKNKSTKFTSWAYNIVRNHLINFCKSEQNHTFGDIELAWNVGYEQTPFWEFIESLSENARQVVKYVMENKHEYLELAPKLARGKLARDLREQGWKWNDIYVTINEIKAIL